MAHAKDQVVWAWGVATALMDSRLRGNDSWERDWRAGVMVHGAQTIVVPAQAGTHYGLARPTAPHLRRPRAGGDPMAVATGLAPKPDAMPPTLRTQILEAN